MRIDERAARFRRTRRDHDGVFSTVQAREAGYSRAAIAAKVARGEWVAEGQGVLRAADHPATPRTRIRVAMLSLGDTATLTGRSALYWWRLIDVPPDEVEVAVAHERRPRPRPGVRVLRRPVLEQDRVVVDGVAVATRPIAVLGAVADLDLVAGAHLVDRVLTKGSVGIEALRAAHVRTAGRRGTAAARTLLALADGGARSEAERTAHRELRVAGVGGWVADHEVRLAGYGLAVLDLAFRREKVCAEIDGWAYHRDLRAFLRDTTRQNALVLEGWTVIRTTWYELTETPELFVRNVTDALAAQRTYAKQVSGPPW
jgi:very-short-patch-repair endonuclease